MVKVDLHMYKTLMVLEEGGQMDTLLGEDRADAQGLLSAWHHAESLLLIFSRYPDSIPPLVSFATFCM